MAKLSKQYYYNSKGEKKLNCYHVIIPKEIVNKANINEEDDIKITVNDNKIIIQRGE